ncbi:hypothetical protein GCM10029992_22810 [Glycomyces albus]
MADYRAELHRAITAGLRAHLPDLPTDRRDRLADTCTGLVVSAFALTRVDNPSALNSLDAALDLITAAE